jgi:hypothetical protein
VILFWAVMINNSELLLEQTDGQPERLFKSEEGQNDLEQADESLSLTIRPRTESLPFTLLYKYDGYWSMRFGDYFELEDKKNVFDYPFFDECNINNI